ncbi:MAG: 4a-hydroxytetrahydrobiopterin dehydratase [Verrucomicrobiae bacterium]|nr:4a-hydroxytetrahydrobiopterin dehydratase [Verrucomicrobiae bacterium]
MKRLTPSQLRAAARTIPNWTRRGQVLSRTWTFADFPGSLAFVNAVGAVAEAAGHHPDITIRWNRVILDLTTHDAGGLTERDVALASALDQLPSAAPKRRRKAQA